MKHAVSAGMGMRMIRPSLEGVSPRSEAKIARYPDYGFVVISHLSEDTGRVAIKLVCRFNDKVPTQFVAVALALPVWIDKNLSFPDQLKLART